MNDPPSHVVVDPPPRWEPERRTRWLFVLESLAGGLTDDGMMRWLSAYETFDQAMASAEKLRT